MKKKAIRVIKKTAKVIVITFGSLLAIMFLVPFIIPDTISRQIKSLVNRSIDAKVDFSKARLSFFNHFPSLTLTLHDFKSTGSKPYQNDTLISANEIAFGIDIMDLIRGDINIDEFYITEAAIKVLVNEKGEANYNIYKSTGESKDTSSSADTTTAIRIEKIVFENCKLLYDDRSSDLFINAKGLNYSGKGDLSKAIFDLTSRLDIDSFDFNYSEVPYIRNKEVKADLITRINTNSLAFELTKNKLRINRLPLEITGKFEFLKKGYEMNFAISSPVASLVEVFSILPPPYLVWLEKTKVKGKADIAATLSGKYIAGTDTMPDLEFRMKVREGYLAYEKAPAALNNLYLDFESRMPALNLDSVSINLDSIFFNVGKDYVSSVLKIKGYESPDIFANIQGEIDLANFDQAVGLQDYDMKGRLMVNLHMNGRYATGQNPDRIRKDIMITSIPVFSLKSTLQNGYLHFTSLPKPIDQFNFDLNVNCPDNNYRNISVSVENIKVKAVDNYLTGIVRLKNTDQFPIHADLDVSLRLDEIRQFYPLDSIEINGNLHLKIKSDGNYEPDKKVFPRTEAIVKVENGFIRTKYYPAPIEKIAVHASMQNKEGTLRDLKVDVQPITFEFEGKPFMVKADLQNFDNISYDIISKGEIDLGRIYKVFSQEGWDLQGTIETNVSLKGNQADAAAGRYSKLRNSGTLKINKLLVYSDLYPLPFLIDRGLFHFDQDHVRFEQFTTNYGKSTFTLSGYVSNLFNYISKSGPLKGEVNLRSDSVLLNELMAYNSDSISVRPDSLQTGNSGVIIIPKNLDLKFSADVKSVHYDDLIVKSVKGDVMITDGEFRMNQTGFELAGASTVMDATYRSISPARAWFKYHVKADEFDVKKMYDEVRLFRELAPAASKAQGIISLDYNLEGRLNGDMYPVMPSLYGGGVLSLKKVKINGLKFFTAMSKETAKEEISNPELNKINLKTTIKNNVVTLEKVKMKVAGFRIRLQGQSSLDGKLKFNCRLGLPPFGIIGIPIKVTGTGTNPIIKLGKTDNLPLEEQEEEKEDIGTSKE